MLGLKLIHVSKSGHSPLSPIYWRQSNVLRNHRDYLIKNKYHSKYIMMIMILTITLAYLVMNSILVLNLLIAAMGDTYSQVSANKHALFRKLRVRAVLTLDRLIMVPVIRRRFLGKNVAYDKATDFWYMEVCTSERKPTEYSDTPWDALRKSL